MPRFAGTPVEQERKPRFGGSPVDATPAQVGKSGVTREQRQADIARMDAERAQRDAQINAQTGRGRAVNLAGRGILEGLAALPDIFVAPAVEGLNSVLPERFQQMNLTQGANYLADLIGGEQVRPETGGERVMTDTIRGITAAATPIGVGRQLAQRALSPLAQRVGQVLQSNPGTQIASGATGSLAASGTREAGGGTGAQLGAGLAGALAPATLTQGVPAALSGPLSRAVPQGRMQAARQARDMGIELTPPQVTGGRFLGNLQNLLRTVPFTGSQGRYNQQVQQFNRQLARTVGEDAEALTPEVYNAARTRQSQQFDELTNRNNLQVDQGLITRLQGIADKAMTQDMRSMVEDATNALYAEAVTGPGGVTIPGGAYQALDSQLNEVIKNGGAQAHYLKQVRDAVRDAMDRSISPEDAQAWRQLRQEYGNRRTLQPLVGRNEVGNISPAQVMGAAMTGGSSREAMAAGTRGPLGDLARIGQMLKAPPSSNTPEQLLTGGLAGGAVMVDPVTGGLTAMAANLLSRGVDSRWLASLMIRENPGLTMEAAQSIINNSAPAAAVQATQGQR